MIMMNLTSLWTRISDTWNSILFAQLGPNPGGTGGTGGTGSTEGDTLTKLIGDLDLTAVRGGISSVVRALGFGPEADNIATVLMGLFIFLVVIGYAAGPKKGESSSESGDNGSGGSDKKKQ